MNAAEGAGDLPRHSATSLQPRQVKGQRKLATRSTELHDRSLLVGSCGEPEDDRCSPTARTETLWWSWSIFAATLLFAAAYYLGRYSGDFLSAGLDPVAMTQSYPSAAPDTAAQAPMTSSPSADNQPAVIEAVIQNMRFTPARVEVKAGDTIEWKNSDLTPHTATAPTFDSQLIEPDSSWRHTFTTAGELPYACTFHPDMKAMVVVK